MVGKLKSMKISVLIPVLNEENNIIKTYKQIQNVFKNLNFSNNYEIVFSDNNSSDLTQKLIEQLCVEDKKVKYIRYKKNIGYDFSLFQGLSVSSGNAVLIIDCDLQDPTETIKDFILEFINGQV